MKPRHAARAVLLDENHQIAILHVGKFDYYKIPGGGIEASEDIITAVRREILEETGCDSEIIAQLGRIENDIPAWDMHDISDGFIARVVGTKKLPQFDSHEVSLEFELEWCPDLDSAIAKLSHNPVLDSSAAILQTRDLEFIRRAKAYLEGEN